MGGVFGEFVDGSEPVKEARQEIETQGISAVRQSTLRSLMHFDKKTSDADSGCGTR